MRIVKGWQADAEQLDKAPIASTRIKTEQGQTLIEVPLTVGVVGGVVGAVLLPVWAAIGAIAALAVRLTLVIEKVEPTAKDEVETSPVAPAGGQEESPQA